MQPLTPTVLRLVSRGASAPEIGWPQSSYENLCRKHGIAPTPGAEPPAVVNMAACPFDIDFAKRVARRGDAFVFLGRSEIALLKALMILCRIDPRRLYLNNEIAPRIEGGYSARNAARVFGALAIKLQPLGVTILAKKGVNGGYRFVDLLASKSP